MVKSYLVSTILVNFGNERTIARILKNASSVALYTFKAVSSSITLHNSLYSSDILLKSQKIGVWFSRANQIKYQLCVSSAAIFLICRTIDLIGLEVWESIFVLRLFPILLKAHSTTEHDLLKISIPSISFGVLGRNVNTFSDKPIWVCPLGEDSLFSSASESLFAPIAYSLNNVIIFYSFLF